jgi:hypothetical protein
LQRRAFTLVSEGVQVMQATPWSGSHMSHRIPFVMERTQMGTGYPAMSSDK